jgi:hypothetical protein
MSDDFSVSINGLNELVAEFDRAQSRALPETEKVIEKSAVNIKTDWAQRWSGLAHAPALSKAISYDKYHLLGSVNVEIGPDKNRRQGDLGNLIEYGSVNNAPHPGGLPALEAEEPRLARALADLTAQLLP